MFLILILMPIIYVLIIFEKNHICIFIFYLHLKNILSITKQKGFQNS